jgi:hypothetical protein
MNAKRNMFQVQKDIFRLCKEITLRERCAPIDVEMINGIETQVRKNILIVSEKIFTNTVMALNFLLSNCDLAH